MGAAAQAFTSTTLVGAEALIRHASEIRDAGFAVNKGEWREGVWGIAAPVFGRGGDPVAAIGVSGPRDRIEPNIVPFSAIVRTMAAELSSYHGAVGTSRQHLTPAPQNSQILSDTPGRGQPKARTPRTRRKRRARKSAPRAAGRKRSATLVAVPEKANAFISGK